jgi:hypothetical protein
MSHNKDLATKLEGEPISKCEKSHEMQMMVGGLNLTPCLVNSQVPHKISVVMESCVTLW